MSVPATDEDQPRENVSIFERYRAQSHIPVPGPASPGEDQLEDLQNTTDTTGCEYCLLPFQTTGKKVMHGLIIT